MLCDGVGRNGESAAFHRVDSRKAGECIGREVGRKSRVGGADVLFGRDADLFQPVKGGGR